MRHFSPGGVGDGADDAGGADGIQLIGIEHYLGFNGLRLFALVAEAVGTDAVANCFDPGFFPAFEAQALGCKLRRTEMMIFSLGFLLGIIQ
jgi:hypothetical protein